MEPSRIKEEWNFVAECRRKGIPQAAYCKNGFIDTSVRLLEKIERNALVRQGSPCKDGGRRSNPFVFELSGQHWTLSNLKQVTFVDISANKFCSVPICVLRMSSLQWLDVSNNNLNDLPQDIDRLEELQSFLLYKNKLTYLPYALLNLKKLTLLVVSGDHLVELPTALCDSSTPVKFISLMDNPIDNAQCPEGDEVMESEQDRQHFDKEFMKAYIEDLKERVTPPKYPLAFNSDVTHQKTAKSLGVEL
ncbi:Leucine-rich repeat-containing protein 2 [Tupaia chinensis]|uniref:Leucine-rich repeat-containing protein 2 n=1 Tax=Tupaia chinensis TaxID=246437 RepID=L8Y6T5_TUPCH|nr:Leucine-rich repeat-containing protein 2 [Tupaia chinensis]